MGPTWSIVKLYVCLAVCLTLSEVLSLPVYEVSLDDQQTSASFNSNPTLIYRQRTKSSNASYLQKREEILLKEQQLRLGGAQVLDEDEQKVDKMLLELKQKEYDSAHYKDSVLAMHDNFLKSRPLYEQSDIFKLIRKMPKGGALHLHDCSMTQLTTLVQDVTYRENCYMCIDANKSTSFHFYKNAPSNPDCPWKLVSEMRKQSGDAKAFDNMLVESMLLTSADADEDINHIWTKFEDMLIRANGLINYKPVFRDYAMYAMQEFYDDNVQYMEVRALLPEVYDLDGTLLSQSQIMELYVNATETFIKDHPDFTGFKIIKSNLRMFSPEVVLADIKSTIELMMQYPGYMRGYDLVGQEDPGQPLLHYLDALRYPSQQTPPIKLPYFFHAGETVWQGTRVDDNLVDAVLLNTTRIGHGYALTKHPEVLKLIKQQNIAIEINPISNQVLKLIDNLQNHPGAALIAENYPVVISSDDPAIWGAQGLSYDFYAAFMALAGRDDGLKILKQLAMNSLIYSAMNDAEKVEALKAWETKWKAFIKSAII